MILYIWIYEFKSWYKEQKEQMTEVGITCWAPVPFPWSHPSLSLLQKAEGVWLVQKQSDIFSNGQAVADVLYIRRRCPVLRRSETKPYNAALFISSDDWRDAKISCISSANVLPENLMAWYFISSGWLKFSHGLNLNLNLNMFSLDLKKRRFRGRVFKKKL